MRGLNAPPRSREAPAAFTRCAQSVSYTHLDVYKRQGLTAATGMDALTHAIEGYITKGHCVISDMFHREAIKLISQSLRGAVQNTPEGREDVYKRQELQDIIAILCMDELDENDKLTVARARKLQKFLSQPFAVAENFTGLKGKYVPLSLIHI